MTDLTSNDAAERLRRLQERRAASARTNDTAAPRRPTGAEAPATVPTAGPAGPKRRRRRSHPAAATRWLLGGLSIASFFGIAGTVAAANLNSVAAPAVAAPTANAAAVSPAPSASAATPAGSQATSATRSVASVAPVAHTVTRGS